MKRLLCASSLLLASACFNPPDVADPTTMGTPGTDTDPTTGMTTVPADGASSSDGMETPTCTDAAQNGDETDVDCGGSCPACADGQGCAVAEDCSSGVCEGEVCQAPSCGDGVVQAGEACDDGGESPTCNADCTATGCGDGFVTGDEECDDAGESATCDADCTAVECGDAVVNPTANEMCDDAGESAGCNADCTTAACGDQTVNAAAGETCDEGLSTATCDGDCTEPGCGDGFVNQTIGESCDDGGESAACDADCSTPVCGDGVVNATAGEDCEGGSPDVCTADCHYTGCGPDPLALAMAACMAQYPNCQEQVGGVVGWGGASCAGCNCGTPADPWRWYCTATSDDSNWNCSPCSVGEILGAHDPCACGAGTSPVLGSFCTP